jgi:hypothetical protein
LIEIIWCGQDSEMRTALFCVITQRVLVIPYRCFGTTYCPIFKAPEFKKKAGFTGRSLYKDERSLYSDESSLYRDESSLYRDERSLYRDERSLYRDERSLYRDESSLYRDERSLYRDERSLYRDESNCHLLRGGSLQSRVGQ